MPKLNVDHQQPVRFSNKRYATINDEEPWLSIEEKQKKARRLPPITPPLQKKIYGNEWINMSCSWLFVMSTEIVNCIQVGTLHSVTMYKLSPSGVSQKNWKTSLLSLFPLKKKFKQPCIDSISSFRMI